MSEYKSSLCSRGFRITLAVLGISLALALSIRTGSAQATQGTVIGTVKDPGGAVVPNAAVTLTQQRRRNQARQQDQQFGGLSVPGRQGRAVHRAGRGSRV